MKPEYLEYALYAYLMIGFLLWLWALVDDFMTGHRHRGGTLILVQTLFIVLLGWPFLVADLTKPRGCR